ncbi:MAG: universal stress protein [Bacteroidales bacterium]|nr:universal stress protein [Bacteroidales bacterium]MCF8343212.1 universal stress protein [Bacteroidales bacterium]MCF8376879.1 universal stress protein [Bacteroidales bacterium]MCF8401516.1 universal stress protein [Bacteroidales bacterium]
MKRIVTPTDFSKLSDYGLLMALQIAKKLNAEIFLLNIIYPPQGTTFSAYGDVNKLPRNEQDRFTVELVRKNLQRMEALQEKYKSYSIKMEPGIEFGNLKNGIDQFIVNNDIDLVVMGANSSQNFVEHFVGNNTEKVIRVSKCPVITTKREIKSFEPKNLVIPLDVDNELFEGLEKIVEFGEEVNGKMHLLHILNSSGLTTEVSLQRLEKVAKDYRIKDYTLNTIDEKNAVQGVNGFAKRIKADMIAMITHGRKGLKNLIFGSMAEELIKENEIPMLIINKEEII